MSTMPSLGHVNPCLAIATALQQSGHEVHLATAPPMEPQIRSHGIAYVPFGTDYGIHPGRPPAWSSTEDGRITWATCKNGQADYRDWISCADDLGSYAKQWNADVLIHDWFEPAGLIVSDRLGLPTAVLGIMIRPPVGRMAEAIDFLTDYPVSDKTYGDLLLDLYPASLSWPDTPRLPYEHHIRVPDVDQVHYDDLAKDVPDWLDDLDDAPVIYLTMGFLYTGLPGLVESVVEASRGLDAHVVMTVGQALDKVDGLDELPPNLHVASYIPQAAVLARCSAVVCHGGFQLLMNALGRGLPVASIPVLWSAAGRSDAQRCHQLGLGPIYPVERPEKNGLEALGRIDPGRLRSMLTDLLTNSAHQERARRIEAEIRALPDLSTAVALVESL